MMGVSARILGIAHVALGVGVAALFVLTPILADDAARSTWDIVNWVMAAGVLSALATSYVRWRASVDSEGREQLIATVLLVSTVLLALAFFEDWFSAFLFESLDDAATSGTRTLINLAFVVINAVVGIHLYRSTTDLG